MPINEIQQTNFTDEERLEALRVWAATLSIKLAPSTNAGKKSKKIDSYNNILIFINSLLENFKSVPESQRTQYLQALESLTEIMKIDPKKDDILLAKNPDPKIRDILLKLSNPSPEFPFFSPEAKSLQLVLAELDANIDRFRKSIQYYLERQPETDKKAKKVLELKEEILRYQEENHNARTAIKEAKSGKLPKGQTAKTFIPSQMAKMSNYTAAIARKQQELQELLSSINPTPLIDLNLQSQQDALEKLEQLRQKTIEQLSQILNF